VTGGGMNDELYEFVKERSWSNVDTAWEFA
jgi:hypothetical protein